MPVAEVRGMVKGFEGQMCDVQRILQALLIGQQKSFEREHEQASPTVPRNRQDDVDGASSSSTLSLPAVQAVTAAPTTAEAQVLPEASAERRRKRRSMVSRLQVRKAPSSATRVEE